MLNRAAAHCPSRKALDPFRPYAFHVETERADSGAVVPVTCIFLTNRQCPWHCIMCDLWKNTLPTTVPCGAIPRQINFALSRLESSNNENRASGEAPVNSSHIKLYNSGSFFDPQAIPVADYPAIAKTLSRFERIIVECHPALIGQRVLEFAHRLRSADHVPGHAQRHPPKLEVAMGLETVHPEVLPRLNKQMTLSQYAQAAEFLQANGIALRTFILVKPPWLNEPEALDWAGRSLDFAFDCGADVAVLIPVRPGNPALDELSRQGHFSPPQLATLESALDYGIKLNRGRVFADLWDLDQFTTCADCYPARRSRLQEINLTQNYLPRIQCPQCNRAGLPANPSA